MELLATFKKIKQVKKIQLTKPGVNAKGFWYFLQQTKCFFQVGGVYRNHVSVCGSVCSYVL